MKKAIVVEVSDRHSHNPVEEKDLIKAVSMIISESDFSAAEISLSMVDDQEMHKLNVQYLDHDYPTDVLSFPLADQGETLIGEIIVSVDTARQQAGALGVSIEQEILLYTIHGALHLVGYDDKQEENRVIMREKEKYFMKRMRMGSMSSKESAGRAK